MGEPTDEELMEAFRGGDEGAFNALFDRHARDLYAFLLRMVSDSTLAEDLLQTTFLSVVRSRGRFEQGAKVGPWLFTIAANAARDALRRKKTAVAPKDLPAEVSFAPPMGDPGLRRELETAFQALPQAQREAVLLHKVQGFSFEQVAEALGTTVTAARLRAHRGYERLRQLLSHLEDG